MIEINEKEPIFRDLDLDLDYNVTFLSSINEPKHRNLSQGFTLNHNLNIRKVAQVHK
jgi:hypothetical protein